MRNLYTKIIITELVLLLIAYFSIIAKDDGVIFLGLLFACHEISELFLQSVPWNARNVTYIDEKMRLLEKPYRTIYYFLWFILFLVMMVFLFINKIETFKNNLYIRVVASSIFIISLYRSYLIIKMEAKNLL